MNERIKELALEAGYLPDMFGVGHWDMPECQKFVKLIVRECLLCCERTISDPVPKSVDTFEQGGIHCIDEIKQHFGVGMTTEDKKNLIKELLGVNK